MKEFNTVTEYYEVEIKNRVVGAKFDWIYIKQICTPVELEILTKEYSIHKKANLEEFVFGTLTLGDIFEFINENHSKPIILPPLPYRQLETAIHMLTFALFLAITKQYNAKKTPKEVKEAYKNLSLKFSACFESDIKFTVKKYFEIESIPEEILRYFKNCFEEQFLIDSIPQSIKKQCVVQPTTTTQTITPLVTKELRRKYFEKFQTKV